MMLFNLGTFTIVHVAISLIGIVTGLVMLVGLLTAKRLGGWTALFLISTVATSVTGFFFPYHGFTPAIGVGVISMLLLVIAILTRYAGHLNGASRWLYVLTAMMALYLNVFVLIVQSFQKIPALKAMAPTQTELPFLVAQVAALVLFVVLTISAMIKFHPRPV